MTKLTDDQVRHIAKLARLKLTDEEVKQFGPELTAILSYIDTLQQVDTSSVEPLKNVTGITNAFREDVVSSDGPTPDELLDCSPLPKIEHQIQTPSAHG